MKIKLRIVAITGSALLLMLVMYAVGYYRGYHDRSCILTSVHLAENEALYDNLQHNHLDLLRENLEVGIYCEKESLGKLEKDPFGNFADEFSYSSAGDVAKELRKADEITKGMTFTPFSVTGTK